MTLKPPCGALLAFSAAAVALISPAVRADDSMEKAAKIASGSGNVIYLAAGLGLPLIEDGSHGGVHTARVADALLVTGAITEGLKALTREKRPDTDEHNSFPSGHTSAAFTVATVESAIHPRQGAMWFAGATAIGLSRIKLKRHHTQDVIVGALIGIAVGRLEVAQSRGIVFRQWIHNDEPGTPISISHSF